MGKLFVSLCSITFFSSLPLHFIPTLQILPLILHLILPPSLLLHSHTPPLHFSPYRYTLFTLLPPSFPPTQAHALLWEQELYNMFEYNVLKSFFHSFNADVGRVLWRDRVKLGRRGWMGRRGLFTPKSSPPSNRHHHHILPLSSPFYHFITTTPLTSLPPSFPPFSIITPFFSTITIMPTKPPLHHNHHYHSRVRLA